ncbi:hypothetical protein JCM21714_934 [Gracilibacillus boraciitolerans JCM 21714]|uniref:NTF2-like N-terminal transpeptidase domain-containing protein n=1 Tax=Gracilibacillus boraciitolerans JCM 21714 TaxID=1298598 RepID=W4VFJ7_9BACI|nr:hypothetical protein JCM21714_934 [Gracilibacillus boraciitolerans JCM 21714]
MKKRRFYYKKRNSKTLLFLIAGIIFILMMIYFISQLFSTENKVINLVDTFYQYEQQGGDFSNSWELFHSLMKDKFNKNSYVQDRSHVFLEHFGVETFKFSVSEPEKIKNYQVDEERAIPQVAYLLNVTYFYESKYGYLEIHQPVIVLEEDEEWKIIWQY